MRRLPCPWFLLPVLLLVAGCVSAPKSAINDAIVAGDAALVTRLIDQGEALEEWGACGEDDFFGETALECAVGNHRPAIARLLLERGADPGKISQFGCPPLVTAATQEIDLLGLLLDKGADPNGHCYGMLEGRTALMEAVIAGKTESVRLLIERGAKVDAQTDIGYSALTYAAYGRQEGSARILLAKGADADAVIAKAEQKAESDEGSDKHRAAARFLRDLKEKYRACGIRHRPDAALIAGFAAEAAKYRALASKPELPEEARIFRVQAEDAVAQKRFQDAVDRYGKALRISPWWPEGHFNQALLFGESDCPEEAIAAMERYLALVPEAADARAARDKVYQWKGRLP